MAPKKQMSIAVKSAIVALHEEGIANREIGRRVGYDEAAVRRFLKKFEQTKSLERKLGTGRKRKTTARDDRCLKFAALENRFACAPELKKEVAGTSFDDVSVRTIERRLNEFGLISRKPAKKPLLTAKMKSNRFIWAKQHQNWTVEDWHRVVFSDESKFNLFGPDGTQRVRRRKGEKYRKECISSTVKHSPHVMVWGCITAFGVGPITFIEGTMNAEKYKTTINESILPAIEDLTQHIREPLFQDDSAPSHRAKTVTELKENLGIDSLSWPGNSPDLNPIENFWALIGKKIRLNKPKTVEELKSAIIRIWYNEIPDDFISILYDSMPRRIKDVIKSKGGSTKY